MERTEEGLFVVRPGCLSLVQLSVAELAELQYLHHWKEYINWWQKIHTLQPAVNDPWR